MRAGACATKSDRIWRLPLSPYDRVTLSFQGKGRIITKRRRRHRRRRAAKWKSISDRSLFVRKGREKSII